MSIKERLIKARQRNGLSVEQVSQLCGWCPSIIEGFEREVSPQLIPSESSYQKLANLYGVNVEWLKTGEYKDDYVVAMPLMDYVALRSLVVSVEKAGRDE